MSLLSTLTGIFEEAFEEAGFDRDYGIVEISQRPDLSQFQCNGALAAAKPYKKPPRSIAQDVVSLVESRPELDVVTVEGPGFINIVLSDAFLGNHIDRMIADPRLGVPRVSSRKVVVDYGGPNIAKEMHVGHLRPAIIGESVKRLLRFLGHDVIGDVHLGDWGLPMGQLICELEDRMPDLLYFDSASSGPYPAEPPVTVEYLQEIYPVASRRFQEDSRFVDRARCAVVELQEGRPGYRALWQHFHRVSVEAIKEVYNRLDVEFDLWNGESTVNQRLDPMVARLLAGGIAEESDGALIIDVAELDDPKDVPPFLLLKSDGAALYTTSDLATIEDRISRGTEVIIYVVDVRQSLHFEQLFRAARRSGIALEDVGLEHAGNGTVNGPDGKPFKTREGGLLRLRELIDRVEERAEERLQENDLAQNYSDDERAEIRRAVAAASLKFGDLQNHRTSNYVFDIDRFTAFEGKTGPYLLYGGPNYSRDRALLRTVDVDL